MGTGDLAILGDTDGDTLTIQERSAANGGNVIVTTPPTTMINGSWMPQGFDTVLPVTNIYVVFPSDSLAPNTVNLLGQGKTATTTVSDVWILSQLPASPNGVVAPLTVNVGGPTTPRPRPRGWITAAR